MEEEEEELELKKELGVSTGGGNSQKSSDCNTQKAGDDTPSVPSPSPALAVMWQVCDVVGFVVSNMSTQH